MILLEKGKAGVQKLRCCREAVKKGSSTAGSSGKMLTVKGGAMKLPSYLKRAMCLGRFQFLRPADD